MEARTSPKSAVSHGIGNVRKPNMNPNYSDPYLSTHQLGTPMSEKPCKTLCSDPSIEALIHIAGSCTPSSCERHQETRLLKTHYKPFL